VSRATRQLLSAIVTHYAAEDTARRVDLDANAELSGSEIEADKAAGIERERATADRLAGAFERGLQRAWERRQLGGNDITLDDRDPEENEMASALIDFLVRFDLAASHSREVEDQHYIYVINVDWDRLRALAAANGQSLDDLFDTANGAA
jgi:hypothetical protein